MTPKKGWPNSVTRPQLFANIDPKQPRDAHGQWTSSGGKIQVAKTTKNLSYACKALGIDPIDAGDAIHAAKDARKLSGADTCEFDLDNGDILFDGEVIGNLHD